MVTQKPQSDEDMVYFEARHLFTKKPKTSFGFLTDYLSTLAKRQTNFEIFLFFCDFYQLFENDIEDDANVVNVRKELPGKER